MNSITLLQIVVFLKKVFDILLHVSTVTVKNTYRLTRPNEYIFFEKYSIPFASFDLNMVGPGLPSIEWFYNPDTSVFYKSIENTQFSRLPWLAASIYFNEMKLYSMDDFIDTVRYDTESSKMPSPAVLVGAWSLKTGILLDRNLDLVLRVITEDGEETEFNPMSFTSINSTRQNFLLMSNPVAPSVPVAAVPAPVPVPVLATSIAELYMETDEEISGLVPNLSLPPLGNYVNDAGC